MMKDRTATLSRHKQGAWDFRAVQLDLARQPETVEYIESFIDFACAYGFNYLVLYLEGRIRTGSFPFSRRAESYSPDQIRRIVGYAAARGMETIPVVSMFGHADIFLECPELEELAELRGGRSGRFSKARHVFCPSQPETTAFLAQYAAEVAELFPSPCFHAGFDEAWDIGYCDLCRRKTQAELFGEHLLACYEIITGRLGKRMMIWDDMFDLYPEVLEKLPRDVILCVWQYDSLLEEPSGHCGGPRTDKLAGYDRLGFRYVFAPAVFSVRNVETFSAYAAGRRPLGGLLTSWELERTFLFSDYPTIAYAGMLWNGAETTPEQAAEAVMNCRRPEIPVLLRSILHYREVRLDANVQTYLKGPLSERDYDREALVSAMHQMLKGLPDGAAAEPERSILEDLSVCLEEEMLYFGLRRLLVEFYKSAVTGAPQDDLRRRLGTAIGELEKIREGRLCQWRRHRPGLDCSHLEKHFDRVRAMLDGVPDEVKKIRGLLRIRFLFSLANVFFSLKRQGQSEWFQAAALRISHQPQQGMTQYLIPVFQEGPPEALRIEASGLAGIGLTYAEFLGPGNERHVPCAVTVIGGRASNPEALLEDGADWCLLGDWEQEAGSKFLQPELAEIRHGVEITLRPADRILNDKPGDK